MSKLLYINGTAQFTIAALDKLAVYSEDDLKIYKKKEFSNHPNSWVLVKAAPAGTEYVTSAFSAATELRIEAGASPVYYQEGVAASVLERKGLRGQGAPSALAETGTLTAAMLVSGIVTSATAAAVVATLDTGAVMDTAIELEIGDSFDWSVIVTGTTNTLTVTASSGHTLVGSGAVLKTSSGLFRTRKTAAATYITYRIG